MSVFDSYRRMSWVFRLLYLLFRSFCWFVDVRRLGLLDMRWTCGLVLTVFVLVIIVPVVGF
jgi:hypothetical protein